MKHLHMPAIVVALALASTGPVWAQEEAAPARNLTPLKVQVVIGRYQGEKKVSSLPFTLSVNAPDARSAGHATLRMGAKVPIPVTTFGPSGPEGKAPMTSWNYQDVGTNIDCIAAALDGGRFRLDVTIDDSSVYSDEEIKAAAVKGIPTLRSFRASDQMVLKDGGTAQFTVATDKVSGEVVKVDVTLTVVK
jgi:hypothetical protein